MVDISLLKEKMSNDIREAFIISKECGLDGLEELQELRDPYFNWSAYGLENYEITRDTFMFIDDLINTLLWDGLDRLDRGDI